MAVSPIFCGHCGAQNPASEYFCFSCGYTLSASATTASPSSTMTGMLPAHTLLRQRYRVLRAVGQGGMGAVYLAQDTSLGDRLVAIKEMSQSNTQQSQETIENFKREAHLLAGLQHPNLPSIYDHFEENGRWYLVMSFIQGETLEDYLSHAPGHKLPLEEVLQIGQELCNVLNYLHTHQPPIIFRDLKPGNVMRTTDGHMYLIDFGIARHFKPGQAKDTANYGSAGYAPPEQYGKAQTTERSDIYSLGVTLYEMLSGYDPSQSPFTLPPLQSLVPTLPDRLVKLITQMLEMDASKRPESVKVVQQELQQATLPAPSSSRRYAPTPPAPKPSNPPISVPISVPTNNQIQAQRTSIPHPELVRAQARIQDKLARAQARVDSTQKMYERAEIQKSAVICGSLIALLATSVLTLGIGNLENWTVFGFVFCLGASFISVGLIRKCPVPVSTSRKIEFWIGKGFATTVVLFGIAVVILTFILHADSSLVVGGISIIIEGIFISSCVKIWDETTIEEQKAFLKEREEENRKKRELKAEKELEAIAAKIQAKSSPSLKRQHQRNNRYRP